MGRGRPARGAYNACMVIRIDGTAIARGIEARVAGSVPATIELRGLVAAGDEAGMSFQRAKQRAAARCGIGYRIDSLPQLATQRDALALVAAHAADPGCGGIVIQLPLPAHLDAQALLDAVPAGKDPDVLGAAAYGAFRESRGPLPPAAGAVREILASTATDLAGKTVAVVGQGALVGRPVADWLEAQEVRTLRLDVGFDESALASADLVVLGTGAYRLDPKRLEAGAGVIDFGYQGGTGDLDTGTPEDLGRLAFYTPTPGGTGPVLVAKLMENFLLLNEQKKRRINR